MKLSPTLIDVPSSFGAHREYSIVLPLFHTKNIPVQWPSSAAV